MKALVLASVILAFAVPARADESVSAPPVPMAAVSTVKCLIDLLKSSPAVQSADAYVAGERRLAIEFSFTGKDGEEIIAYLMLLGSGYHIELPRNEPEAAGWESIEFVTRLNVGAKCDVTPALDSVFPGPKPRTEWQRMDPSTLSPSAAPSPQPGPSGGLPSLAQGATSTEYTQSGRMCIPTAEMLSLEAAIGKDQLASLEKAEASLDATVNAPGGILFQNEPLGIAFTIPRFTPPKQTRSCQPEGMFDNVRSISAAYILSFGDVLGFRKSYKWPIQGANLSAPASITILTNYGKYVLVLLDDDAIRKDASGNIIFDCGGGESYRVNPATGQVLPYNSCVEAGGVRALPGLAGLPD